MVTTKIVRTASAVVTTVGLVAAATSGIAGASANTITLTGYKSDNVIVNKNTASVHSSNHTNLLIGSANLQASQSGDASADKNTTTGNVASGASSNNNSTMTNVTVSSTTPTAAPMTMPTSTGDNSIGTTGAQSDNKVINTNSSTVDTHNDTNIAAVNFNGQESSTGDASATKNTTSGNVTSGNSTNTNTTDTTIVVTTN